MFHFYPHLASSIVPFDDGQSYVVRALEVVKTYEFQPTDRLGRTEQDLKYLKQFECIFLAAAQGNLEQCRSVVREGFRDFSAVFITPDYDLRGISPIQIARVREKFHVAYYLEITRDYIAASTPPELNGRVDDLRQPLVNFEDLKI